MGSFRWRSMGPAVDGLSHPVQALRGWLRARRPAARWALAAGALAAVLLLAYRGVVTQGSGETVYLHAGRRLGPDDLSKIGRALDRQRIAYYVDDERRVAVASAKRDQAEEVVAKLDLGPRPPGELRDLASAASPWEPLRDRELREARERAQILQAMIDELPGVIGSFVSVNRPKARFGLQPGVKPSAFVRVETDDDRQLPFRTVQSITTILTGFEEGLASDAITVVDRRGHKYLIAGNSELSALSSNRAREEELSQEILRELDAIKGVRVSVRMPANGAEKPVPTPAQPVAVASPPTVEPPAFSLALNRPMALEPEPAAPVAETQRVDPPAPPPAPRLPNRGTSGSASPVASTTRRASCRATRSPRART